MKDSKMSKSSGDFVRLETLMEKGYPPLVFRYFCLQAHYRSELSFTWASLKAANTSLMRLYDAAYSWGPPSEISEKYYNRFVQHLYNDLNLPQALAIAWELVRSGEPDGVKKATLLAFDKIFGLDIEGWMPEKVEIPEEITSLLAKREEARQSKDWEAADRFRDEISKLGFSIEDSKDGPIVKRD